MRGPTKVQGVRARIQARPQVKDPAAILASLGQFADLSPGTLVPGRESLRNACKSFGDEVISLRNNCEWKWNKTCGLFC